MTAEAANGHSTGQAANGGDEQAAAIDTDPANGGAARPRSSLLSKMIVTMSAVILLAELALLIPLVGHYQSAIYEAEGRIAEQTAGVMIRLWESRECKRAEREGRPPLEASAALAKFDDEVRTQAGELGSTEAVVLDMNGAPVGAEGPRVTQLHHLALAARQGDGAGTASADDRLLRLEPVAHPRTGEQIGWLLMAAPLAPLQAKVVRHVLLALGLVLLVVIFVGIAAIFVAHRILLRQFRALARANRALVEGDEDGAMVPESEIPDDELGDLMRSRNEIYRLMLGYQRSVREKNQTLARQGLELERWARELERRVAEKQQELATAHEQLLGAEKLAATGRLAAGLAHELNNPLASIAGYAEDLLELSREEELQAAETFRDFPDSLRTIEEQAYRCKRILNQLLSFARPASFEVKAQALGPIVHGVLPLVEHRAKGRDIAVMLDLDPELGPALVDRANLEHVLVNLIENAFDAIDATTGRITIATGPAPGGMQAIEVRDTGKGIDDENRRRIFDPFFTTKSVGDGTGLGLSICHSIVTKMGGNIDVRSEPGRGAAFTVVLPGVQASVAALPVVAA